MISINSIQLNNYSLYSFPQRSTLGEISHLVQRYSLIVEILYIRSLRYSNLLVRKKESSWEAVTVFFTNKSFSNFHGMVWFTSHPLSSSLSHLFNLLRFNGVLY